MVKEGWADKETGKKGEPRIQFLLVQYLQDVLPVFAKKLIITMNIQDVATNMIHELSNVFQANKGDHSVSFEVRETEIVKVAPPPAVLVAEPVVPIDEEIVEPELELETEPEEIRVVTRLAMPSRKVRVKICSELLRDLEKMNVNFKLN
jgi:DNA polymerase-3 subunit alpha